MLDHFTHLFRLRTIAAEGSMSRAAESLNLTQPALTHSVAQLERHFGKPLLVRHARGVTPTVFGARVIATVDRLARHWELAERDLSDADRGMTGVLRLRAGPLWRAVVLPDVVSRFQNRYPGLNVEIEHGSFRSTVRDLTEGRVDVIFAGVQIADGPHPRIESRQFTVVHDRVVARADHPIFGYPRDRKGHIDPRGVLDFPWIVYTADPVYELETVHGTLERVGQAPDIRIRSASLVATLGFVQKGDYLCVLPEAAIAGVASPPIAPVPVELGHRMIQSGALFREEMSDWPPLVHLLDLAQAYFEKPPR